MLVSWGRANCSVEKHKGKTLLRRSTGTLAVNKDNKTKPKSYNAIRKDLAGVVMTRVILKLKADSNSQLSGNTRILLP